MSSPELTFYFRPTGLDRTRDLRRISAGLSSRFRKAGRLICATRPLVLQRQLRFGDREKAAGVTADELMTGPAVTIGPDAPVAEAARLMRDRRVKRLPVISHTRRPIGIISRADVLRIFARPDAGIRREASAEVIAQTFMADSLFIAVTVHDGIVTLTGRTETGQTARELAAAIRRVEGVVACGTSSATQARRHDPQA